MKIRTDFVTNSSSSSFVLEIYIELENGKTLSFEANGGTGESGIIDYFWDEATVTVSPKQLGSAKSVRELIDLLKNGVYDGWVSHGDKLFENKSLDGQKRRHNPTHFLSMIEEYVASMDDIKRIIITGDESSGWRGQEPFYYRTYAYSPKTDEYTCAITGCEFEKNGSSGGDLIFDDADNAIEVDNINPPYNAVTTKGYAIQKGKEAKQKMREAVLSGNTEVALGKAGVANELSKKLAREISSAPESITFSGKNFVHSACSEEEMIDKFVLSHGGEVRSSTVLATNYLIVGNGIDHKTTKISRAKELNANGKNIIAMTESEFWTLAAMCGEEPVPAVKQKALTITSAGSFPNFTQKHFSVFAANHNFIYKTSITQLTDYIVVEHSVSDGYLERDYPDKVIELSDFLDRIGVSKTDFDAEMALIVDEMKNEKERLQALGNLSARIDDIEKIEAKTYENDLTLQSVVIGGNVKVIGKRAFAGCSNLSELVLEEGIVEIEEAAFSKCVSLESIVIPSSVKAIRQEAFSQCKKLKKVVFKNGLEVLEKKAFNSSPKLKDVELPDSLTTLYCDFTGCKVQRLSVPEGITRVSLDSFSAKKAYLKIPSTTEYVSNFFGESDVEIEYNGSIRDFFSIEFSWGMPQTCLVKCTDGEYTFSGESIEIPEGVTELRHEMFQKMNISTIVLPNSLQRLRGDPFLFARRLKKICYNGTKEQWTKIDKSDFFCYTLSQYNIYCRDGIIMMEG